MSYVQAAIDNMNDGEMFGRTLRVNFAKPMKISEGSTRPVWARYDTTGHLTVLVTNYSHSAYSDEWLQKYAGASLTEGAASTDKENLGLVPATDGSKKSTGEVDWTSGPPSRPPTRGDGA